MNKPVKIMILRSKNRIDLYTDIKKMYNTVQLSQEDWHQQRYIWQKYLDKSKLHEKRKIIKTLIYGVKSSSN